MKKVLIADDHQIFLAGLRMIFADNKDFFIAKEVNMVPDELIGNLGDVHLYLNHIEQAKEQIGRKPFELPELRLRNYETLDELLNTTDSMNIIQLWRYDSHPTIKAPLSN